MNTAPGNLSGTPEAAGSSPAALTIFHQQNDMSKRPSRPHGEKEFTYHQRQMSPDGVDNYDRIFGKKDFISKKVMKPEQKGFKGNSDRPAR